MLKKTSTVTFLVAEGVIIIAQQCYTPRWKALNARFQVITEPFLCDKYFLRYLWKCKAEGRRLEASFTCFTHGDKNDNLFTFCFPVSVLFIRSVWDAHQIKTVVLTILKCIGMLHAFLVQVLKEILPRKECMLESFAYSQKETSTLLSLSGLRFSL